MCLGVINPIYDLIYKYSQWANFDWLWMYFDRKGVIRFYDYEEKQPTSLTKVLRSIFDNGMLDECFSEHELEVFFDYVPDEFKMEINYYLEELNEN